FTKDLKTIADAQHRPAFGGEPLHSLHDRAESRNGSRAKIISIAEPTRNNNRLNLAQGVVLMPQKAGGMAQNAAQHVNHVLVAIRAWKLEHGKVHSISNR